MHNRQLLKEIKEVKKHKDTVIRFLAVSPDEQLLASAETGLSNIGGYGVKLWDLSNSKLLHYITSQSLGIDLVAFSINGSLAIGEYTSNSMEVKIWDIN